MKTATFSGVRTKDIKAIQVSPVLNALNAGIEKVTWQTQSLWNQPQEPNHLGLAPSFLANSKFFHNSPNTLSAYHSLN